MSFWKDKQGNDLGFKLWMKKWGEGIKQVATSPTPLERLTIELRATMINLIGMIVCLIALIVYKESFFVDWFAYGLMAIFVANIITTGLKYFGLHEQKKLLKSFQVDLNDTEEIEEQSEDKKDTPIDKSLENGALAIKVGMAIQEKENKRRIEEKQEYEYR